MVTAGVFVLLFLAWQLWINDRIVAAEQSHIAEEVTLEWSKSLGVGSKPAEAGSQEPPPPIAAVDHAQIFATLIVPRWGQDYTAAIAEGVTLDDVLNTIGLGHYPGTAMPGDVGNFAVAGHRTTWGSPLWAIEQLRPGDALYVETSEGWYRYIYRSREYVLPDGVDVLQAVPQMPGAAPGDRVMTLTSCNPRYSAQERYIAYAVFDTWFPRADGPPAEIADRYEGVA